MSLCDHPLHITIEFAILSAVSLILFGLRTWVETRDWRERRRLARKAEKPFEPIEPSPPFDPVAYEARKQELLRAGRTEWAPGIFAISAKSRRTNDKPPSRAGD